LKPPWWRRATRDAANMALVTRFTEATMLEHYRAGDAALEAERALASAKGQDYAAPIDFPVMWNTGAPLPHLLRSDYRTYLLFTVAEPDPGWDGSSARIIGADTETTVAIVSFERC
jgi:hypothetical protein